MYKKKLIEMAENVMKRMRWKAFLYLRNEVEEDEQGDGKHYGFNSHSCPHQIDELKPFENDMAKLIENVEFRRSHGRFQSNLKMEITYIRGSQAIFVPADKIRNFYMMKKAQHEKLLHVRENIMWHYRSADKDA